MGNISDQKLATMNSFLVLGVRFFAYPSSNIPTKHNIKETANKRNIWGLFYITKRKGLGGG